MELAERQSRGWIVAIIAFVIIAISLMPAEDVFHLGIVAVSTILGGAIVLAALIAITDRRLW